MILIKTVQEAAAERMNQCSDTLAKKFLKSVRSIYGSTENGRPLHIGTGTLITFESQKILLTAAHVIDTNDCTTLYVSGDKKLVQITGECLITSIPQGNRKADKVDFAALPLSPAIVHEMGDVEYLSNDDFMLTDPPLKDRCCLSLGFPNSKNKKYNQATKKVKQEPFVYTSTLKYDEHLFRNISANPIYHYLLNYCKKHSKDESGNIVNSISPKGVSGGGLFLIEGMANPESYKPNTKCNGKLLGILIEYHQKEKVLLFIKLSVILNALTKATRGTSLRSAPHAGR